MSDELIGIALALLAAGGWASASIFARLGLQHVRNTTGTMVSMVAGLAVVGAVAIPFYGDRIPALPLAAFGWFALLGLLNFPLGRFFSYTAMHLAGVARASPIVSTSPLWATIIAIIILNEAPTPLTLVGAVAIVGGLALIMSERTTRV